MKKLDYVAKLTVHNGDSVAIMVRVSKWLAEQSKSIEKELRLALKETGKNVLSGYGRRATFRLMK